MAPENATYEQMRAWFERFCVFVTSVTAYVEMNKGDGIVYPSERSAEANYKNLICRMTTTNKKGGDGGHEAVL